MIGKIKGVLIEVDENKGLVETAGGVFYIIFLPIRFVALHKIGEKISIYTYLRVKEDNLTLYGFENKKQQRIFEMLITVSGIGPKSAFTIISHKDADELSQAILTNNVEFFEDIPGVGKKSAHKILLELSSKMGKKSLEISSFMLSPEDNIVIDALASLGFNKHDGRTALSKLDKKLSIEDKIKKAIRLITNKK